MIKIIVEDGEDGQITVPVFVCDYCQDEITDCGAANMLWDSETYLNGKQNSIQFHVHKRCNRPFEQKTPQIFYCWWPLDQFLDFLCKNSGFEDSRRAREARLDALSRVGYLRRRTKRKGKPKLPARMQ